MKEIIDGLDRELNELKTRAYDNVSEKLKVFEDDFFKDLSERGENLNTSLMPCSNEAFHRESFYVEGKYRHLVFLYAGSFVEYQCINDRDRKSVV